MREGSALAGTADELELVPVRCAICRVDTGEPVGVREDFDFADRGTSAVAFADAAGSAQFSDQ
jgi:hypothetical protein